MKEHFFQTSRRFFVPAEILVLVALGCLLNAHTALPGQLSQLAVAPGLAKTSDKKASKPRAGVSPDPAARSRLVAAYGNLPLSFEANQGQTDARVEFLSRGSGYTLFLTSDEAVLAVRQTEGRHEIRNSKISARHRSLVTGHPPGTAEAVVRMKLLGANPMAPVTGLEELPGKSNYFIGNDPKKWRTDVPNYAKVQYKNIYPGVDLVYYGNHRQLEYDFEVAPGADPSAINLEVAPPSRNLEVAPASSRHAAKARPEHGEGMAALRLAANGDLLMRFDGGQEVRFHKPVVYQDVEAGSSRHAAVRAIHESPLRHYLDSHYVLKAHNQVSFQVGAYDKTKPLVIDPVLTYSSLLGGSGSGGDAGFAIAVDGSGNAYLTGDTSQDGFPIVNQIPGACNGGCGSGANYVAFVTKINTAGSALVYSSFIGGGGGLFGDAGYGVAVDSSGSVYLTGQTNSSDFPIVNQIPGACNGSCGNGVNAVGFVTKISAAGNALVYSSLFGGSGGKTCRGYCDGDSGRSIAVDSSENAYLTGSTASADFPRVNQIPGACNGSCGTGTGGSFNDEDAFVAKVNAAGNALVYSSLVGGSNDDDGIGIAVDTSGNAYLTGETSSTNFPQVNQIPGACNGLCGSGGLYSAAFVTKVSAAGNALVYSSLVGGSGAGGFQGGQGVAVDASDNVYLTGETNATDFPIVNQIPGACNGNCGGVLYSDAFVTKVNAAGSALVYSSRLGGSSYDDAYAIALDGSDDAYLTGTTDSTDFPQVNQIPGACEGGTACPAFVTEVNAAGDALVYSSYLGGDEGGPEGTIGFGIAVDGPGDAYLTGWTNATDFPRVHQIPGACNGTCGTGLGTAVFVTKVSASGGPAVNLSPTSLTFGPQGVQAPNVPQVVTLTNTGQLPLSITSFDVTGPNSGDFLQANNCPISPNTLGPGDNCAITVVFNPTGSGTLNADVTITDNAPGSPQSVALTGTGVSGKPGLAGPKR